MAKLTPVHPGEILLEEFLQPLEISQYRVAKETGVPARRINEIVLQQRGISADTALRLARYFGTSELFWLNLQARYELDVERARLGSRLAEVRSYAPAAAPKQRVLPKVSAAQAASARRTPLRKVSAAQPKLRTARSRAK